MSRPTQIEFLSRFAVAYDPVVRFMGFAPLWKAIADVAAPAKGEWALDVCTGTGGAALELASRGAHVVGLDLAMGMLRQAQRKGSDAVTPTPHFVRMNACRLAFADHCFPLVTCSMALHEMAEGERTRVLAEIARVASDRVVIAEYRVPPEGPELLLFRMRRAFEYAESDDFGAFVRGNLVARFVHAGLWVDATLDIGAYRIWACRLQRRNERSGVEQVVQCESL